MAESYSLASAPSNGTRRGLTRVFNTGPVTSHAAPARPPQPPEQRMRRSTSPTVRLAPWKAARPDMAKVRSPLGADPRRNFSAESWEVYGAGAYLLAGSEVIKLK